eukprot:gene826-11450_t
MLEFAEPWLRQAELQAEGVELTDDDQAYLVDQFRSAMQDRFLQGLDAEYVSYGEIDLYQTPAMMRQQDQDAEDA